MEHPGQSGVLTLMCEGLNTQCNTHLVTKEALVLATCRTCGFVPGFNLLETDATLDDTAGD